jgi:hypothetical protein
MADSGSLINMSFFITYCLLQPFMIIIGRKIGPRWFLPTCVVSTRLAALYRAKH